MESISDDFTLILWVLARLVIFSLFLERALYFIFDYTKWRDSLEGKGIRAPLSLIAAWAACYYWEFDAVYPVLDPSAGATPFGIAITATIVAGGSQGAMVLFQDVLNFSRQARTDMQTLKQVKNEADKSKIEAEIAKAKSEKAVSENTAKNALSGNLHITDTLEVEKMKVSILQFANK